MKKRSTESGHRPGEKLADKHNIKRVNRAFKSLLARGLLLRIWLAIMRPIAESAEDLFVLVDWTGGSPGGKMWRLSASLWREGRSIPLYDVTVPQKKLDNPKVVSGFLDVLKKILPEGRRVLVITDAGFRLPFFNAVTARGWDFLGRLRGNTWLGKEGEKLSPVKELLKSATPTPRLLKNFLISKTKRTPCPSVVVYREPLKGRKDKSRKGTKKRGNHAPKYSRAQRDGWILLSSATDFTAAQLVGFYKKRMTCEQTFRDLKSPRFGLGLEHARTKNPARYDILCLIGGVTALILSRLGQASRRDLGWAHSLQANTVRHRRVFSDFTLGGFFLESLRGRLSVALVAPP